MSEEKIYLNCPFDEKDECKSLGGKWDGDEKKWFITDNMDSEPFAQWLVDSDANKTDTSEGAAVSSSEKTYLNCPFEDKDECKALGGRWDGESKKWYVPAGQDTAAFKKWI